MAVEAATMVNGPAAEVLRAFPGLVADTPFGRAWAVAAMALAMSLVLVLTHERRAPPLRALALAVTVVAVAHADAGHAGANGFGGLALVMSAHLLATALWAGGVLAAALCLPPGGAPAGDGARYATRLATLASAALAVVVLTGVASAWHGLGGALAPMATSSWGVDPRRQGGAGRRRDRARGLQPVRRDAGAAAGGVIRPRRRRRIAPRRA
jgi:putative copper export protein